MRFNIQKKNEGFPVRVSFHDTEFSDKYFGGDTKLSATGVVIKSNSIPEKNKWYTIEICVKKTADAQSTDDVEVYIFDRDSGEGTEIQDVVVDGISMMSRSRNNNGKIWVGPVGSDSAYIPSGYNYWDTEYLFDNFIVYNRSAKKTQGIIFLRDNQSREGMEYTSDMTSLGISGVMNHSLATEGTNVYRNLEYISADKENFFLNYKSEQPIPCDDFVFSVDVIKKSESGSIQFDIGPHGNSASNKIGISYMIPAKQLELNRWYTYMFVKRGSEIFGYRKLRDELEFESTDVVDLMQKGMDFDEPCADEPVIILAPYRETNWSDTVFAAIMKNQYAAYGADTNKIGLNSAAGSEYGIDNLEISGLNSIKLLRIPESDGFKIKAEVAVWDGETEALVPVIGVFDENGRYMFPEYGNRNIMNFKGESEFIFSSADDICTIVENGGKTEFFVWAEKSGKPLVKESDISDWFRQEKEMGK